MSTENLKCNTSPGLRRPRPLCGSCSKLHSIFNTAAVFPTTFLHGHKYSQLLFHRRVDFSQSVALSWETHANLH